MRSKITMFIALAMVVGAMICSLTSCRSTKEVVKEVTIFETDTIRETDTVIIVKERLVKVDVPVPDVRIEQVVPDDTTSVIQTDLYKSTAWITGGLLHHTLENVPDAKISGNVAVEDTTRNVVDRERSIFKAIREEEKTDTVYVNELTKAQKFFVKSGKVLWSVIGLIILSFAIRFSLQHYGIIRKK